MQIKKIVIIGTGLIGGSFAKALQKNTDQEIIGVDIHPENAKKALELGLVHRTETFEKAAQDGDLFILAIPVNAAIQTLPHLMDLIPSQAVVMDVCSTKKNLIASIKDHPKRGRFVPVHPMAGTEYSGPEAAVDGLFENKIAIICDVQKSDQNALDLVLSMLKLLKMKTVFMDGKEHDIHAANVSHISHITSFALALAVLEAEKGSEDAIRSMAAGGFRSTVRLAKSDAETWEQILMDNTPNVLNVLNIYQKKLAKLEKAIRFNQRKELIRLIKEANGIRPHVDAITETPEECLQHTHE